MINAVVQFVLPGSDAQAQIFQTITSRIVKQASTNQRVWKLGDAQNVLVDIGDFIVFLAAALLVIMLLWVGISYLMAGSDESKVEAAKTRLKYTIVGAAIVMGIGVILATIGNILSTGSIA